MDYRDRCGQIFNSGFIQLEPILNVIILILQQPSKKRISYFISLKQKPRNFTEAFIFCFFCILLLFTLFFLHFLSLLYWQCMLLHVIFGILHHSFLIICVPSSLPFPARRQMLSFTICRIFYPRKHKCRCMRQRHLNKERNFFGGESVL